MGAPQKPYRLRKRPDTGYYQVKMPWDTGWRSLGLKKKKDAIDKANEMLSSRPFKLPSTVKFSEFTHGMFEYDTSSWVKYYLSTGRTISRSEVKNKDGILRDYLKPRFGKIPINMISAKDISDWMSEVTSAKTDNEPLSPSRKRKLYVTMKQILDYAQLQNLVDNNATRAVIRPAPRYGQYGILTKKEIASLFPEDPNELKEIWGSMMWASFMFLAYSTGARLSELRALRLRDINLLEGFILIDKAVKKDKTVGSTKKEVNGVKVVIDRAKDILLQYFGEEFGSITEIDGDNIKVTQPKPKYRNINDIDPRTQSITFMGVLSTHLAFPAPKDGTYLDERSVTRHLYAVYANKLNIYEPQRKSRGLTFQSFRNAFNTYLRGHVTDDEVKMAMLHAFKDMTDWYDRRTPKILARRLEPLKDKFEEALSLDVNEDDRDIFPVTEEDNANGKDIFSLLRS